MRKILLAVIALSITASAYSDFLTETEKFRQYRSCIYNAKLFSHYSDYDKSREDIAVSKALKSCQLQVNKYGMVWDMPFEKEIKYFKKQEKREARVKAKMRRNQEDQNLLGTY